MKLARFLLNSRLAACLLAFAAFATASAQAQDSKITKLVGNGAATVTRNGSDMPATEGMAIQVGDVINAPAGVDVFYQPYNGAVATVKGGSKAKIEDLEANNALIDMTGGGSVVAQIEPNKGNKFAVRTPKGVAAARGTVYNVTVSGQAYTVVTFAGGVSVFAGNLSASVVRQVQTQLDISASLNAAADRVGALGATQAQQRLQ